MPAKPRYFAAARDFHDWLSKHHGDHDELLVGFHKRGSASPCMTWPESVEQALCFGWIDGVRKRVDEERYTIRFTPRRASSIWSAINIALAERLTAAGKMAPAGKRAFEARSEQRSRVYSHEREQPAELAPLEQKSFKTDRKAWRFFSEQAPWYQRSAYHWVVSAKKPETRAARLAQLIADSASGLKIKHLRR